MVGAEIFLSAFLQVLFERLTPRVGDLWNLARRDGLEKKLEALVNLFRTVEAVLADAEEKMFSGRAVKVWLDDLQDLAYDTEDVLDEISTEALRLEVKAKQQQASSSLIKFASHVPARFTPSSLKFKIEMGSKIDVVMSRLEDISKRKDQLCLVGTGGGATGSTYTWKARLTTSTPIEAVVYGREDDRKKIIDLLTKDEESYDVIPIVSMGGAGKTTLAQHVYRDPAVAQAFTAKAWVCVSNDFDVSRVMRAILEDLTSQPCELKELQSIQKKLKAAMSGKRFLIVLDDIWDHTFSQNNWLPRESLLTFGAPGSKMIITTRQIEVADKTGSTEPYMLKPLSPNDCWLLFMAHAFKTRGDDEHPRWSESFREKIISKCAGLPLAARTLGGLLHGKPADKWEEILNSKIWTMDRVVLPVLRLSYHYLPRQLKKCFGYCVVFPQDYEFTEEELVLLWMAEGLIVEGNKQAIEAGRMCFRELVSVSLFQTSTDNDSKFIMHDLVHELAQQVEKGVCFQLDGVSEFTEKRQGVKRARHLSFVTKGYDSSKRFEGFRKAEHLRTFLRFDQEGKTRSYFTDHCYLANSVLHQIPQFKRLRTLSLSGYNITELPDSIGNLKYLRYLDLSSTQIRCLPESTCSLYNLLILSLRDCGELKKLPSKMENLISLCYLDITAANSLKEMPPGMGELKSLQVLSNFIVGKGGRCSGVNELMNLKDLRGKLCISKIENVGDANDANNSSLNEKEHLEVLELRWDWNIGDFRNAETEKCVLHRLQPHKNLKELIIGCYGGNAFSIWLGNPSFSSMKILKLENCNRCTYLPSVGQLPSLKVLEIRGMDGVKSVGAEFSGSSDSMAFLSLESLSFHDMREWENWNVFEVNKQVEWFSRLCEFSIVNCPKLLGNLPNHLTCLKKLEVRRCEKLNVLNVNFPETSMLEIDCCEEIASGSLVDLAQATHVEIRGNVPDERIIPLEWKSDTWYLILYNCGRLEKLLVTLCSLTHLRSCTINGCSSLISPLPSALFLLPVLETIDIHRCANLKALIDEEGFNLGGSSTTLIEKRLFVSNCEFLVCLSSTGMLPASISNLVVDNCGKLEYVAKMTLPASLTNLDICDCEGLEFVAETFMESTKIESISFQYCNNLQRLPDDMHTLSHLKEIIIINCRNLLCFPQGGLPKSNNLKYLCMYECEKLVAPSLIESDMEEIPVNNLPISVMSLGIVDFRNFTSLSNLPISLTELQIWDCANIVSLPNLPTRLIRLMIYNCENLKCISSSSFNNFQNLTSLESLELCNCPKLKSLPKEGLPPSLEFLDISNCPLLEERCKRDKGKDWRKIADIPCVKIDRKYIYA
ncbi:putative disease resistance RPP13-like protein 1 [Rutidosis leptorrhynchoides]|uniref:putative disease resistance RPP13-like protein 1 n=1 Tax=Rutidosis leptorrhynchoides TaxID=125765 RepID=UPI003A98E6AD